MSRVVVALEFGQAAPTATLFAETIAAALRHEARTLTVGPGIADDVVQIADLPDELERIDASMLIVETADTRQINTCLQACRTLRIPYL